MNSAPGFIFWRQVSLVYSCLPSLSVIEKRAVDRAEFPTVPCATKSNTPKLAVIMSPDS
jgi:hypothetical protein